MDKEKIIEEVRKECGLCSITQVELAIEKTSAEKDKEIFNPIVFKNSDELDEHNEQVIKEALEEKDKEIEKLKKGLDFTSTMLKPLSLIAKTELQKQEDKDKEIEELKNPEGEKMYRLTFVDDELTRKLIKKIKEEKDQEWREKIKKKISELSKERSHIKFLPRGTGKYYETYKKIMIEELKKLLSGSEKKVADTFRNVVTPTSARKSEKPDEKWKKADVK